MTMFRSLGARIYAIAALAAAAALLLGGALLQSSYRSRDAFRWVDHTQTVIISLDTLQFSLSDAESGLRGYLLTGNRAYLDSFNSDLSSARRLADEFPALVADSPAQQWRSQRLRTLAHTRIDIMARAVARSRRGVASVAMDLAQREHGRVIMAAVGQVAGAMRAEEHHNLLQRTAAANHRADETRVLLLLGCPVLALLIGGIAWMIRSSMARPLADLLDVVTRFGEGDRGARAATDGRSREFQQLAVAYNSMAERLAEAMAQQSLAEGQLAQANDELVIRGLALERRQQSIALLNDMAHRLQAIQGEGEFAEVLDCFLPKVLPDVAGALYVHNNSRNLLVRFSGWGDPRSAPESVAPNSCWALRRGQPHAVNRPGADLVCAHAAGDLAVERLCEPVLAGGEVLGLLYVEGLTEPEQRFRLGMLKENVALALVNEQLRRRLREQSIRDPLTHLFNRRYMEEAMLLEAVRAERNGTPLSIVMADVDHFKRFNDGHGHEAGDALLKAVANLICSHFRHGDIVCRYGGEEIMVIAPGAEQALVHRRVEALRRAVADLTIEFGGNRLGPVTMSFGIDTWMPGQRRTADSLIGDADRALFRAKRLGRNRVEPARQGDLVQAAE